MRKIIFIKKHTGTHIHVLDIKYHLAAHHSSSPHTSYIILALRRHDNNGNSI